MNHDIEVILSRFHDQEQERFCVQYGEFLQELLDQSGMNPADVLDLGCGTGCLTESLGRRGHWVHGLEQSATMLEIAHQRCAGIPNVKFTHGELTSFVAPGQYSLVVCNNDTVNDMVSVDDLSLLFKRVKEALREDGLFVLDFATGRFFEKNDVTQKEHELDGVIFSQRIEYDSLNRLVNRVFEFAGKKEIHYQRAYMLKEVQHALAGAGFGVVDVFSDFTGRLISPETTQRIFITAAHVANDV